MVRNEYFDRIRSFWAGYPGAIWYSFALQRPPVVYRRRVHMRTKDSMILAVHDALQESQKGSSKSALPNSPNQLDRQIGNPNFVKLAIPAHAKSNDGI